MAKRVLLLQNRALAVLFKPRGTAEGVLVRVAGPTMPVDAKILGAGLIPDLNAFGLILESPAWPDLLLPGERQVNGMTVLPSEVAEKGIHFTIVNEPAATFPLCAIEGYDETILDGESGKGLEAGQDGGQQAAAYHKPAAAKEGPAAAEFITELVRLARKYGHMGDYIAVVDFVVWACDEKGIGRPESIEADPVEGDEKYFRDWQARVAPAPETS